MTLLRRAAVGVSGFVARHASDGSQDWAEGLAREVEFIDGDWNALRWALSSLPVLLDRREAQLRSLQDVPAAAKKLGTLASNHKLLLASSGLLVLGNANRLIHSATPHNKVAVALVVGGWISCALLTYVYCRKLPKGPEMPTGDWTLFYPREIGVWTLFYQAELQRRLEFISGPRLWLRMIAVLCVGYGWAMCGDPSGIAAAWILLLFPVGIACALATRKKLHRKLDRLNVLLAASAESDQTFST